MFCGYCQTLVGGDVEVRPFIATLPIGEILRTRTGEAFPLIDIVEQTAGEPIRMPHASALVIEGVDGTANPVGEEVISFALQTSLV